MRTITGEIVLPNEASTKRAGAILVEVRDVSLLDAPSTVVANQELRNIFLNPGGRIAFMVRVPEVPVTRTLSIRVHISLDGSGRLKPGDLLTTASYPVPSKGTPKSIEVPVSVI
jgi:uncharacterized lipoprotein YbaY